MSRHILETAGCLIILWDVTWVPPIGLKSVRTSSSPPSLFISILTSPIGEKEKCISHLAAQAQPQFHG